MKILVDHGAYNNLGDLAMLEAIIHKLGQGSSELNLYIKDCPLPAAVWQKANIKPIEYEIPDPTYNVPYVRKIPYLRRNPYRFGRLWLHLRHLALNRGFSASQVNIQTKAGKVPLDEWCREFDALQVAGGGDLNDIFTNELWQRCCLIYTFAAQGKPIVLTGQQLGPFSHKTTRKALQRALKKVDFVGLREPTESLRICQQARLNSDRFAVMGDDSFGLPIADSEDVQACLARWQLTPGKFIAVNIRIGDYASSGQEYLEAVAARVTELAQAYTMPVVVVPIALDAGDSDVKTGHRLAALINQDWFRVLEEPDLTASLVKGILGQAYAGLGVSYHFCTFALTQGVPAIALFDGDYYTQKAQGISSFWRDSRLAMSLNQLCQPEAHQQIREVFEAQELRQALNRQAPVAVQQWHEIFDKQAQKLLKKGTD